MIAPSEVIDEGEADINLGVCVGNKNSNHREKGRARALSPSIVALSIFTFYNHPFPWVKSYLCSAITLNNIAELKKRYIVLVLTSWTDYGHFLQLPFLA